MIGKTIQGCKIIRELGQGGMGAVYLAEHSLFGYVAIKALQPLLASNKAVVERFKKEAVTQYKLKHDNIVKLDDFIEEANHCFLRMEYVEGKSLDQLLANGKLPESQAIRIAKDALRGLNYAHQKGVVHRDVKPSNIIIAKNGEAKIMDFGIALVYGSTRLTRSGVAIGTPLYMSPEQIQCEGNIDHRTDVYSMGAALYEMLAGKPPFDAVNDFRLYQKILNEKPLVLKGVPSALAELVYKSLEKEPDKRFSGCGEFLSYLEAYENKRLPPPIPEVKPVVLDNEPRVKVEPRQIPEAKPVAPVNQPKAKEKQIVNKKDGSLLVLVPAGEFERGDGRDSDNPIHKLYLDDYYIGVYAVTNKQYEQFVKETGHRPPDHSDRSVTPPIWKGKSYPQEYADHPVVCVSWDDATEYCKWAGLWLPTEAQWEKAARGPKGYIYPWGNDWDKNKCRNYESSVGGTCRVNDYPLGVSGYGAYNMSGNVWEWCRDFYSADYYKSIDSYRDPIGPLRGASRVLRGGSWLSYGPDCRSAHRFRDGPGYRHGRYGLRACLPEVSAVR